MHVDEFWQGVDGRCDPYANDDQLSGGGREDIGGDKLKFGSKECNGKLNVQKNLLEKFRGIFPNFLGQAATRRGNCRFNDIVDNLAIKEVQFEFEELPKFIGN